jgi:hypothetical protein
MSPSERMRPSRAVWQRRQAFRAQDTDPLSFLWWSDDLVVNSPINRLLDRNQVLDLLPKSVIRHASYEAHIEVVRRHGDVVTETPDAPPVERCFTNVWHATGQSWRMIARHANPAGHDMSAKRG